MADIKWIKLYVDMFDHKKIKFIRKLPEGNDILLCWVMLLTSAGKCNTDGYIFLTSDIPYTAEMLADEFNMPPNTVRLALETFKKLNMVDLDDNGIHVSGWQEYQNIDGMELIKEQTRQRVAKHRQNKKLLKSCNDTCNVTVTQSNATEVEVEVDLDKELDLDSSSSSSSSSSEKPPLPLPEKTYQDNIGLITPIIATSIKHWIDDGIEEALISRYIEVATKRGKRNWAYIEKMIKGNFEDGIKTVEQYASLCKEKETLPKKSKLELEMESWK
jgi:predicted phage replisome organizer